MISLVVICISGSSPTLYFLISTPLFPPILGIFLLLVNEAYYSPWVEFLSKFLLNLTLFSTIFIAPGYLFILACLNYYIFLLRLFFAAVNILFIRLFDYLVCSFYNEEFAENCIGESLYELRLASNEG
jgi:hypothetical protein